MPASPPTPLVKYLESLPPATLCRLWVDTRTAVAVYGQLAPLAQYTIGRLLLVRGALPFDHLRSWHPPSFRSTQNGALLSLKHLQILQGRSGEVWLNEEFRTSLQRAFAGDLEVPVRVGDGETNNPSTDGRTIQQQRWEREEGEERWEGLLYNLVAGGQGRGVSPLSHKRRGKRTGEMGHFGEVLQAAGLISGQGPSYTSITSAGFKFLLLERYIQLWTLLTQYLAMIEASTSGDGPASLDIVSCIMAICRLSLLAPGASVADLLPAEMLDFLADTGLVVVSDDQTMVRTTELVKHLRFTSSSLAHPGTTTAGHIIVETNYKVYAYTSSPLEIAILGLFVKLHDRFPNMVQGQLTGPSVQGALSKGISAAQLIGYLEDHLHPTMRAAGVGLSPVIADQIHLWERDRNQLRWGEGYLYQEFMADEPFRRVVQEAQRLQSALYVNYQRRLLVVKTEAHPSVRDFIKREIQ